jgi:hypothetical protein
MDQRLASWNDGKAKSDILAFIRSVTTPGDGFVAPADRIATFDNDGTLWCEKPMYVQADFVFRRWTEMVKADPAKAAEQPYKAMVEGDRAWLAALESHVPELLKGLGEAFGGITTAAFEEQVRAFYTDARHPTLGSRTRRSATGRCASCSTCCTQTSSPCTSAPAAAATSCARSPRRCTESPASG